MGSVTAASVQAISVGALASNARVNVRGPCRRHASTNAHNASLAPVARLRHDRAMRWVVMLAVLLVATPASADKIRAPFKVTYDADHLDLDKRVLQFKPLSPLPEVIELRITRPGEPAPRSFRWKLK